LEEPYAPFLLLLVPYKAGGIVNQEAVEQYGDDYGLNPVGTGPFEWVEGDPRGEIVLEAFDDYYAGRSELDRLVFVHVPEDAVAYAAFEGGELDMTNVGDPDVLARYQADSDIVVATNSGTNVNYIPLLVTEPPFDDLRVRQAVQHAIDTRAILETVLAGVGAELTGPVPTSTNYYEADVPTLDYDPERARELLAEAGYPDGFDTTLYTYIGGAAVPVSTVIQDMLRQIGIRAELRPLEISAWVDVINESVVPASYMRITRSSDPHEFLQVIAHSESVPQWNFGRYDNPEVDRLIEEGAREADPAVRAEIYSQLQKIIVEDAAFVWIFSDVVATAHRPEIEGFVLDPLWNQRAYPIRIAGD
jgi:peptide/nickel transport system substrate-binding protein